MQKELKELSRARLHNYYILHISFLFTKIFPLLFIVQVAQPESERTDCEPRVPRNQHSEALHQQPGRIGDRSYISGERMLIFNERCFLALSIAPDFEDQMKVFSYRKRLPCHW